MSSIFKAGRFAIGNPFGCFLSLLLSLTLIGATISAFVLIIASNVLPSILKDSISQKTGFYIKTADIKYDISGNKIIIKNLKIENPAKYSNPAFLEFNELKMAINPIHLLRGKISLKGIDLNIKNLNCERMNASDYNLLEFLAEFNNIVYMNKRLLREFKLHIENANFADTSTPDKISWSNELKFDYRAENVSDSQQLVQDISSKLDKLNASYISDGLKVLRAK